MHFLLRLQLLVHRPQGVQILDRGDDVVHLPAQLAEHRQEWLRRAGQKASAAGRVLRSYRRNPSSTLMDTGLLVVGAGSGAVFGTKAFSMLPVENTIIKNGAQRTGQNTDCNFRNA